MLVMKIGLLHLFLVVSGIFELRCCAHDDVDDRSAFNLEEMDRNGIQTNEQDSTEFPRNEPKMKKTIAIVDDSFVLDGTKGLHIVSGSLHYFRTPAVYWRDILSKLKAAGLNSVSTYVEWSFHEPEERQYDFSGDRDVAQFVRTAAEVGLYVLLRPGPYICAERDLGGLPYWLLGKYPQINLRSRDENFLNESKIWFDKLFEQVSPLLYGNGGPIILVQVENEYGSYGRDKEYMGHIRDFLFKHVQGNALLYTTDGANPNMFMSGSIDGALTTIDFGSGANVTKVFNYLRSYMPSGPLMNSEFYPGWLTHWREPLQHIETAPVVEQLNRMLTRGIHVNFYVFFGGSNFEFTSGANYVNSQELYQPDITSYDYDAPITEAGDLTEKYFAIRNALEQHFPEVRELPLPSPIPSPKGSYGAVKLEPRLELLSDKGRTQLGSRRTIHSTDIELPTFEKLRQRSGMVLYEITITARNIPKNTYQLIIKKPRDRVYVFVDGKFTGTISRMDKKFNNIFNAEEQFTLSLLVENQGRINYGNHLHDFKGIGMITLNNVSIVPGDWSVTGFKLENMNVSRQSDMEKYMTSSYLMNGPVLYDAHFTLPNDEAPRHTFLNTDGWGKGYVWINGHNLGRYWPSAGPQITLFVPGAWLNAAPQSNHLHVLELEQPAPNNTIAFTDHPIYTKTRAKRLFFL